MHTELQTLLTRLAGAVALALVPVVLATVLTVPPSLHHLAGNPPVDPNAPAAHMC
jgi:hypothetical protein